MKKRVFEHNTIKRRLIVLFAAVLCFVGLFSGAFVFNTFSLKNDLVAIEDFYSMFNAVLELRRYEKNILFGIGNDNYEEFSYYLTTLQMNSTRLDKAIKKSAGITAALLFQENLAEYAALIEKGRLKGSFDGPAIREFGKELVDFSQHLLKSKRDQIHQLLRLSMVGFLLFTSGAFIVICLLFYSQTRNMLIRLGLLRMATRDVIRGSFTPLPEDATTEDEISGLIKAFNKMIAEIDTKQDQLIQSRKLAAIGTFSSGIAHELNNPLNNISLTADTLLEEYGEFDEQEEKELIGDIIAQTERASKVVRNLLDFSRETAPAVTLLDMKDVLKKTEALIANQLRLQSIWLEDYIPDELPPVRGDMQKLQQVFLNLFLNAIHVMPGGGLIHLEGAVTDNNHVRIDFNDTGSGIPAEKLGRIFDPFFTTKPVGQGTGLGLSIVYGIIKKHGGYVEVRSKVNVGTTFSIYLPVVKGEVLDG